MTHTPFSSLERTHSVTLARLKLRDLLARRPLVRHAAMLGMWTLIWLAAIALPILLYAGGLQLVGNIDTVERGKLYRAATLSGPDLDAVIRAAHIQTVINLRGPNPNQPWYQDEVRVTEADHVRRIDLPLSAMHVPGPKLLGDLIDALEHSPGPILVHCSAGSDRTGLAAAIYEMMVERKPVSVARGQLSFYWGHFPYLTSRTGAMDETFASVAAEWVKTHPEAAK